MRRECLVHTVAGARSKRKNNPTALKNKPEQHGDRGEIETVCSERSTTTYSKPARVRMRRVAEIGHVQLSQ